MSAVYEVKTKSRRLKLSKVDMDRLESEFSTVPQILGQAPSALDDDFRSSMDYARQLMDEMKKKAN